MIIYITQNKGKTSEISKVEYAVKCFIENESTMQKAKSSVCNELFNVEETRKIDEFLGLEATNEPVEDSDSQKFIENIPFMKEFVITAEMLDGYDYNASSDAKRRAENFIRAYFKARNKICEAALINGEKTEMYYNGKEQDISLPSGEPLFSDAHKWGNEGEKCGTQSNYFRGNFFESDKRFEKALKELCGKLGKMKSESGEPLKYVADTIIIPCNQPKLHEALLAVTCIGDFRAFRIVVMPDWYTDEPRLMLMSSKANKELSGNMLFNREPCVVSNWVDSHTGNYIWNGRCRFGVGFGTYKHILLAVDSKEESNDVKA